MILIKSKRIIIFVIQTINVLNMTKKLIKKKQSIFEQFNRLLFIFCFQWAFCKTRYSKIVLIQFELEVYES